MSVAVLQSYRTSQVPAWINQTLASVRHWAALHGYHYVFTDDAFFDYAPAWVRQRCGTQLFPVTDIARLYYLQAFLDQGYQQVVWVDADVLVFAPHQLDIRQARCHAFSREVMLHRLPGGGIRAAAPGLNNAVMVFGRGSPVLPLYRAAAERCLQQTPPGAITRTQIGPQLLQQLAATLPLARLNNIGLFTPALMQDLTQGSTRWWQACRQAHGYPLAAANLCHFVRHQANARQQQRLDHIYRQAIEVIYGKQAESVP